MMAWFKRRAMDAILAAYAVIIVLQLLFGGFFDLITNIIILILLFGASRIDQLERWWASRKG